MAEAREKNAAATRAGILAAARRCFAADSYDAVGMRDVAAAAGVNVALVSRYFGSKEELFRRVLLERDGEPWFGGCSSRTALAEWLAALALDDGDGGAREDLERLYIILRSASSPATARIISGAFVADVFDPLTRLLGEGDAEVRAGLALSLVIGATVMNGIMSVEPVGPELRAAGRERLVRLLESALTPAAE